MNHPVIIHPVILSVPKHERRLKGKDKVAALRRIAREALHLSAKYSDITLGALEKTENGAPLPSNGICWSLTHKECYVAAVTSPHPIGIDIEKNRPCNPGLYDRLAGRTEWALAPEVTQTLFYRYWTAKEAVLKAEGIGLAGLTRCRIAQILDDTHLELTYDGAVWRVTHCWSAENHIVSVTADDIDIEWNQPH